MLVKGAQVHLTGRLQTRSREGEGGEKRYRTEVVCNTRDVTVAALPRDTAEAAAEVPARGDDHDGPNPEGSGRETGSEWQRACATRAGSTARLAP